MTLADFALAVMIYDASWNVHGVAFPEHAKYPVTSGRYSKVTADENGKEFWPGREEIAATSRFRNIEDVVPLIGPQDCVRTVVVYS